MSIEHATIRFQPRQNDLARRDKERSDRFVGQREHAIAGHLGENLMESTVDLDELVDVGRGAAVNLRLYNASVFLSAFGHVVAGWLWLDQALAAASGSGNLRDSRFRSCRYFVLTELPKARQQLALVRSLNDEAVQFADALF